MHSAKAQLQNRFGASVAEVDHHELWQRAALTVACVAREAREAEELSRRPSAGSRGQEWELVSRCTRRSVGRRSRLTRDGWRHERADARVNEAVREVVAEAVGELKDPRIGLVTVTGVRDSPDLREGTVFVACSATSGSAARRSRASSPRTASSRAASHASCGSSGRRS